jgi:hypothetical protein
MGPPFSFSQVTSALERIGIVGKPYSRAGATAPAPFHGGFLPVLAWFLVRVS